MSIDVPAVACEDTPVDSILDVVLDVTRAGRRPQRLHAAPWPIVAEPSGRTSPRREKLALARIAEWRLFFLLRITAPFHWRFLLNRETWIT